MRTSLSPDQIESYRRDGFIMIEDFLSPRELTELRLAVDTAVAQLGDSLICDEERQDMKRDGYYARIFTQRINLHRINETIKRFFLAPDLGRMMAALEGVDGYRVWHDQALIKEPWGNPTAWHLDNPYWSFHSRHAISIWVALDDATMQNGCLYFMPGTHSEAVHERNVGITQELDDLFNKNPEWRDRQPVPAPMRAGSCSFHNGLTAHGAGANMSPGRRRAMTCAYMPVGSTFNGITNILPPSYMESLKIGDILDNEKQNPLVWQESTN